MRFLFHDVAEEDTAIAGRRFLLGISFLAFIIVAITCLVYIFVLKNMIASVGTGFLCVGLIVAFLLALNNKVKISSFVLVYLLAVIIMLVEVSYYKTVHFPGFIYVSVAAYIILMFLSSVLLGMVPTIVLSVIAIGYSVFMIVLSDGQEYLYQRTPVIITMLIISAVVSLYIRSTLEYLIRGILRKNELLKKSKESAELSDKAKSDFLANVAHDLRSPLHAMLGFNELAKKTIKKGDPKLIEDFLEEIKTSGNGLLLHINDLLILSKLEHDSVKYEFEEIDILLLADRLKRESFGLLAGKSLSFEIESEKVEIYCDADREKISQVFRNLISNAVKFSPDGSTITVKFSVSEEEGTLKVDVMDEGFGVPEDEVDIIFDKYVQGSTTGTLESGTGLGLSICRSIVFGHSGVIFASNRINGGAVFTFIIPIKQPKG